MLAHFREGRTGEGWSLHATEHMDLLFYPYMHRTVCVYVTHESESFLYSLLFRKQSQKLDLKMRGEGTLEVGKERDSHLDKWIRVRDC